MAVNYRQNGATIDYTNTGESPVAAGSMVVVGTLIGVALTTIAAGKTGSLGTSGVWELPKASGAVTQGAVLYADTTAGNLTTVADAHVKAGVAWADAASADATVVIRINE